MIAELEYDGIDMEYRCGQQNKTYRKILRTLQHSVMPRCVFVDR
jgi:hypothetical protein